jgi:hypothetical protein
MIGVSLMMTLHLSLHPEMVTVPRMKMHSRGLDGGLSTTQTTNKNQTQSERGSFLVNCSLYSLSVCIATILQSFPLHLFSQECRT